ncbi:ABC-type metal ion transport system, periplasmic component surface adhesin [Levilactobacillus senmaizukei DSM 21775 = NBRC 103853]|uniref:ABC-type metal ion transport system, periplasmic component surface adhesin n=1 Tax=Levilactobacillus senmaizukei DSM 21775 = NBRC 103853 TaxID=1423803 RepID=A0A0R2DC82_9LACO|nr:ABC-type metal ion transport system, periplasmic component surface adhesin [Levilactobacillus senmaizukei DSM 21775 = NBRC 103853]
MTRFTKLIGLTLVSLLMLTLTGCSAKQATTSPTKPIQFVASVDFYGEVAKAVLGNHGTVTTIINSASVDPHDFEPTPKDAQDVSLANVTLANGIGYDAWMQKLVKSESRPNTTNIRVGEDVMHKHTGDNEHLWYDPETMGRLATHLAQQFGKRAPKYRRIYAKNTETYLKHLEPLQGQVKTLKQSSNHQLVDVSEPVFDYALSALGYRRHNQAFELAVENGTDPSPQVVRMIQTDIRHHLIAFFVNNSQSSDKTVAAMVTLANSITSLS